MPVYYPVFLNLEGRRCVIIGGGEVAERKVHLLKECGAYITFISPQVTPAIQEMVDRGDVELRRWEYRSGDLDGAFLAIAATDNNRVNRAIAREAEERQVLLNVVDVPHLCTFIAPSIVRRGEVMVAISTAGRSPALARKLREELPNAKALEWADLAQVLSEVRLELKAQGIQIHPDHWQKCIDEELLALVQEGREREAKERLLSMLKEEALTEARSNP